jgi:hypothetical protein
LFNYCEVNSGGNPEGDKAGGGVFDIFICLLRSSSFPCGAGRGKSGRRPGPWLGPLFVIFLCFWGFLSGFGGFFEEIPVFGQKVGLEGVFL